MTLQLSRPIEEIYLLNCLASPMRDAPVPLAPRDLNWGRLQQLLANHRLEGLFYSLDEAVRKTWPAEFQQSLYQKTVKTGLYGYSFAAELAGILRVLQAQDIPVIVMKGWALIPLLYQQDASRRGYTDVDLLVPPRCAEKGIQALVDAGYVLAKDEPWPGYNRRYGANQTLISPRALAPFSNHLRLELHWALIHVPFFNAALDVEDLFKRSIPVQIENVVARALGPEDMLIHLSAHQELHHAGQNQLFRDYDLAAWITAYRDQIDWRMVARRAAGWQFISLLQRSLRRLDSLWPGLVSPEARATVDVIRPSLAERALVYSETIHVDVLRVIEVFFTLPWKDRLRYLGQTIFPGPEYLQTRYGRPPLGFWPLLYVQRALNSLTRIPTIFSKLKRSH